VRWYACWAIDVLRESRTNRRRRSNRPGNLSGKRTAGTRHLWKVGFSPSPKVKAATAVNLSGCATDGARR